MDAIKKGDYAGALPEFTLALQVKPDYADAYYYRALVYDYHEDYARAIADYDQVGKLKPEQTGVYQLRGYAYYRQGDLDHAIADLNRAITIKPDAAMLYVWRGDCYADQGNRERAIENYVQALKLKANFGEAYIGRGTIYCLQGQDDKALADFNALSRSDSYINKDAPKLVETLSQISLTTPGAIETRKTALAEFLAGRAALLAGVMDFDSALYSAWRAIRLKPDYAQGYEIRGMLYEFRGSTTNRAINQTLASVDYNRAIAEYTRLIQLDPKDVKAYLGRGEVLKRKRDTAKAAVDFAKVLELTTDPNLRRQAELGLDIPQNFGKPVWSPDAKKIAFESTAIGMSGVFVVNTDGSQMIKLAKGSDPAWSPDGAQIAYEYVNVYVMNADGSNQTKIAENGELPAWSSDGKRIAFISSKRNKGNEVYIGNVDGSQQIIIGNGNYAAWSPDSKQVAFAWRLAYISNADGSQPIELKTVSTLYPIRWSPDGKKIVWSGLEITNSDGSGHTQLVKGNNPSWSPDSKRIAFDNAGAIYVIGIDGSGQIKLANGKEPAWSPDGHKITFVCPNQTRGYARSDICVMNPDGSEIKNLTIK